MKNQNPKGGLIKAVVVVIVALAILSYFGLDMRKLFTSAGPQNLLTAAGNFLHWLIGAAQDLLGRALSVLISLWNQLLKFLQSVKH